MYLNNVSFCFAHFHTISYCAHSLLLNALCEIHAGWGLIPGGPSGQESTCQSTRCKRRKFDPWVGKVHRKRKWQPTPIFLPGESHEQRSPVGYRRGPQRVRRDWETDHTRADPGTSCLSILSSVCLDFSKRIRRSVPSLPFPHALTSEVKTDRVLVFIMPSAFSSKVCIHVHMHTWKSKCYLLSHVWLCVPIDCSPPGSSVHGILQARILEW